MNSAILFSCILFWLSQQKEDCLSFSKGIFLYFVFCSLRIWAFPYGPYATVPPSWRLSLDRDALASLSTFLIIFIATFTGRKSLWQKFFRVVFFVNSALMLIGATMGTPYGILLNASMSGCFEVALLPLVWGKKTVNNFALVFAVVVLSNQSLPLALFAILIFIALLKKRKFFPASMMPIVAGLGGYALQGERLLNPSGRQTIWVDSFHWWQANASPLWGAGSGTFETLGPLISKDYPPNTIFTFLHSDWLQIGFEQGVVGLILAVVFFAMLLRRAKAEMFYTLFMYGAWMIANMPLRYPLAALYGSFLIRSVLLD